MVSCANADCESLCVPGLSLLVIDSDLKLNPIDFLEIK
jgi:hypothetical protein